MSGTGIKQNNNGVMVDRKYTHHYRCPFRKLGECGEVHPSLADLDHLSLALTLVDRTGYLPLERFPRLRAVLDEVGRASTIETTIVAVSWSGWRKARPRALLRLLLNLWRRWSVESCLLRWSGYHLPGKLPQDGARGVLLETNRYLDDCGVAGPVVPSVSFLLCGLKYNLLE
jgi:hypothetical protein